MSVGPRASPVNTVLHVRVTLLFLEEFKPQMTSNVHLEEENIEYLPFF